MAAKDLTGVNTLTFDIRASRTGSNLKFGIHDTGGTTTEITPNILVANTWQDVIWDISAVSDANKNAIDTLIITVINADAENTFYIDNFGPTLATNSITQSKFNNSSLRLPESGTSLSTTDSTDWYFGTGDFTIDFWVMFDSIIDAVVFCGQYEDSNNYWYLKKDSNVNGNKLSMKFMDGASSKGECVMLSSWSDVVVDTWYHVEFSRKTTNGLIFINGIAQTLTTTTSFSTNDVGNMSAILTIGQQNSTNYLVGYLDEFRISKGIYRHSVSFAVQTGAYGGPNYAMAYNYYTNSFWPQDNMTFLSSCSSDDGAGQRRVYATTNNYAYLMDEGDTDDGTNIVGYWTSARLDQGSEIILKRNRRLVLTTSNITTTPLFTYRTDWSNTWNTSETLATAINTHVLDLPVIADLLQFKISDTSSNPAFEVIRASLVIEAEGVAK